MYPREKYFADLLTKQNRKWEYPTQRFDLGDTTYRPDFFLPEENLYIEVVGSRQAYHSRKDKISKFKKLYPNIKFLILDPDGEPYPSHKRRNFYGSKTRSFIMQVSKEQKEKLRKESFESRKSIAQIIREAVEDKLGK